MHGKKAISRVQKCTEKKRSHVCEFNFKPECTEKKRSHVCKIARKKSGIKCAGGRNEEK